ncbi:hypothetical protein DTO195F2_2504 [Paecilomyces variotii]|nr:hypothetical protein DTO195F2_2504 [Paecilomyces variotii]
MLGTQNLNIFAASTDHSEDVEIWITEAKSPAENVDLIIMMNPFLLLPGIWFTGVEPWYGAARLHTEVWIPTEDDDLQQGSALCTNYCQQIPY